MYTWTQLYRYLFGYSSECPEGYPEALSPARQGRVREIFRTALGEDRVVIANDDVGNPVLPYIDGRDENTLPSERHMDTYWIHVSNSLPRDEAEARERIACLLGLDKEACFSMVGADYLYHKNFKGFFAYIMRGTPSHTHDYDVWSWEDPSTGRLFTFSFEGRGEREAWLIPAEAEMIAIATDQPHIAKAAESMGISVVFTSAEGWIRSFAD